MKDSLLRGLLLYLASLEILLAAGQAGLRLNTSPSVPRGFYWISLEPSKVGDYVAVCPPQDAIFELARARGYVGRGSCPGNYAALIKVLAAAPGDRVRIDHSGVRVGDRFWPSSAPSSIDAAGRPLVAAVLERTIDQKSVLLMSEDCPSGFDARYFGLLSQSDVVGTAVPLLTW